MAYSRYFGMRSFENVVRDGRFRVPATGTPFKIGAPVMIDAANAGYMKAATASAPANATSGLAIYEHIQNKSDALTTVYDGPYDAVPLGQYAQIMHGPGTKVWFKDVANKVLYDGRTQVGGSLLAAAVSTYAIADGLTPDGAGKFKKGNGTTDTVWFIVEQVNPTTGLLEARLNF